MSYDTSSVSLGAPTRKDDYDRLMDNIVDLAGSGRTTENVKTNYDLIANAIKTTAIDYTVLDDDGYKVIWVTASSTITLPTALVNPTRELTIINAAASGTVTVDGEDAETINGTVTVALPVQFAAVKVLCNGTAWGIVAGNVNKNISKAWVNFNGTGTVAIRDSYNVSSITDGGVGIYTINFTNEMADVNYAMAGTVSEEKSNTNAVVCMTNGTVAVGSVRVEVKIAATAIDTVYITLIFFGS